MIFGKLEKKTMDTPVMNWCDLCSSLNHQINDDTKRMHLNTIDQLLSLVESSNNYVLILGHCVAN